MNNLEKWNFLLDSLESPQCFIDWTWYLTVSAALQRRVCINGGEPNGENLGQTFPNIFVVFIGPPGVGKTQAADVALSMFRQLVVRKTTSEGESEPTYLIKTGPDSVTQPQLLKYMATNYTVTDLGKIKGGTPQLGKMYPHSSLAFFCGGELACLLDADSEGLVTFLTRAWDGGDYTRETKTQGIDIIKRPCITLLGSAVPQWVRDATANKLLKQGFAARTIFLYAGEKRKLCYKPSFNAEQLAAKAELQNYIKSLTELFGQAHLTPEADQFIQDWYHSGGAEPPKGQTRLEDYYGRKRHHLFKMTLVLHFSESLSMTIELASVKRALAILTEAEPSMAEALSYGGENPIYACAQEILKAIDATPEKRLGHNALFVRLFDVYDEDKFGAALRFLCDTGQITSTAGMKGLLYERPKK